VEGRSASTRTLRVAELCRLCLCHANWTAGAPGAAVRMYIYRARRRQCLRKKANYVLLWCIRVD
jgi:hypothetical protein